MSLTLRLICSTFEVFTVVFDIHLWNIIGRLNVQLIKTVQVCLTRPGQTLQAETAVGPGGSAIEVIKADFEFLVVSDWGCSPGAGKSCPTQKPQRAVAAAMSECAQLC